jgi:ABC-type multidrug transport system fused ATPase/permease subunit
LAELKKVITTNTNVPQRKSFTSECEHLKNLQHRIHKNFGNPPYVEIGEGSALAAMAEHLFSLPTMATEEQAPPPEEQAPTALDDDLPTQSLMELIGPSSVAGSSTSNKNDNGQAGAPRLTMSEELAQSQEKAIQTLLDKCAQNNVSINDNLRRAILGEELFNESENKVIRRETFNKRQSLLTELVRSRKESENYDDNENNAAAVDDVELMRELRSKYEILKRQNVSFEVRIKDGSYHVDVPMAQEGKGGGVQHIATVTNAGVVPRMMTAVQNSRKTGSFKTYETKTIVEGINLVLDAGKMYLVLGGPGSGKSTRKCSIIVCIEFYLISC